MNISEVLSVVMLAAGGSAIIVAGLSAWLGKVWADRIAESERSRHALEIERLKSALDIERARAERNSRAQFDLYARLWRRLQDVKFVADLLWERPSVDGYWAFTATLAHAKAEISRGRLVLNERDYLRLNHLLNVFEQFEVGKKRLIDLRSREELETQARSDSPMRLESQLHSNAIQKQRYESLLEEVLSGFRTRLGIDA